MLMINYSQRSLFKWEYAIVIILIITAILTTFSFQINRWLPEYALSFSNLIAQGSQTQIDFGTVRYRFPNHVIFKNVTVLSIDRKSTLMHASRLTMGISFPLFSSAAPLDEVVIKDMTIDFPALKNHLTLHGKRAYTWAKIFPKGRLHLLIPNGQILLKSSPPRAPITFNVDLKLDQDHLHAHGSWKNNGRFNYEIYGNIHDSGFDLEKLTLQEGRSSMNLWGNWYKNEFYWKGFIFYDKFYILDIDGHLNIQKNDILLKPLSFSIDGDDVTISGECTKQNLFQCDAAITYQRSTPQVNPKSPLESMQLHCHAQNTPRGIIFKGTSDLNFLFDPDSPASLQRIHLDFKNLKTLIVNGNFLKLRINQLQSAFTIHRNEYKVLQKNILASINFSKPYQKDIVLSAGVYAGNWDSRIHLNTAVVPWLIKGQGEFKNIDMDRLSDTFYFFKQCHGLLSGNFNLQSSKNTELVSTLTLHHGVFNDSDFQAWIAKTIQMPSLNHVSRADLSGRIKIDGKSKMMDDLKLNTDNFDLRGFFHLDADDMVSSRIAIRFSKKLLDESPRGRDIIGMVRGAWTLPFEFSLSGALYRMNFQWDNSPLKNKVRQHIFSFIQRMIDQHMDDYTTYKVTTPNESVSPG